MDMSTVALLRDHLTMFRYGGMCKVILKRPVEELSYRVLHNLMAVARQFDRDRHLHKAWHSVAVRMHNSASFRDEACALPAPKPAPPPPR